MAGKLLYSTGDGRGNMLTYLSGTVRSVSSPGSEKARLELDTSQLITTPEGKQWQDVVLSVGSTDPRSAQHISSLRLEPGKHIVAVCSNIHEDSRGSDKLFANYRAAMYTGYWDIPDRDRPDVVIVAGYVDNSNGSGVYTLADGSAKILLACNSYIKATGAREKLFFTLALREKTYKRLVQNGFNGKGNIVAVGVADENDVVSVGSIDWYPYSRRGNGGGNRGSYNRGSNNRTWSGSSGYGMDD